MVMGAQINEKYLFLTKMNLKKSHHEYLALWLHFVLDKIFTLLSILKVLECFPITVCNVQCTSLFAWYFRMNFQTRFNEKKKLDIFKMILKLWHFSWCSNFWFSKLFNSIKLFCSSLFELFEDVSGSRSRNLEVWNFIRELAKIERCCLLAKHSFSIEKFWKRVF